MLMLRREGMADFSIVSYDPAIPAFAERPEPADFVLCLDVLEHVEPACLADVLADLHALTLQEALLVIALHPSSKTLADGRNAHLIVESPDWWTERIAEHFTTDSRVVNAYELRVLLKPKEK